MTESVFLKAWEKLPSFGRLDRGINFRAWLYRIAHNAIIDVRRRYRPELDLDDQQLENRTVNPQPSLGEWNEIKQALKQLDETAQHVVISRFLGGLSCAEIARSIGLSEGNVRLIQHRALKKLRKLLGEEHE